MFNKHRMAIAPAIISHYHNKRKHGKVTVGHFVGSHPLNREKASFSRALVLAFITGLIWAPWYAFERVREASEEVEMGRNYMILMVMLILGISFFMGIFSRKWSLAGFVTYHKQPENSQSSQG